LPLPTIEYDLSNLTRPGLDVAGLESALREKTPLWILHPEEKVLRERLDRELREQEANFLLETEKLETTTSVLPELDILAPETAKSVKLISKSTNASPTNVLRFEWHGVTIVINVFATTVVWACTSEMAKQKQILAYLTADAAGAGLHCYEVIHTRGHGVLIASGTGSTTWGMKLKDRLAASAFTDW
jgi:hypothetical protein